MMKLEKTWYEKLKGEIEQPYIQDLKAFLEKERRSGHEVYPPEPLVFHAFSQTPYDQVKVVLIGQDPYHGKGQAHGLSFSVPSGVSLPPSLRNIYREMEEDLHVVPSKEGCLTAWAKQGVLLLNATLTVRAKEPKSHHGKGWERFTDAVVRVLLERKEPVIFLLWGKSAQEKCAHILEHSHHVVLTAAHPSPYSAHSGFFGCRHFSKTNAQLKLWDKAPIEWSLT
ncbi:MAG: uracil-DNA glycosylase [Rhabdochlamydiaceae bacterium]|nr:uracil-DNA glycosylase [Rhabdochlamydiaceae bacterium]